jgi:hypothetical protein
MSSNNSVIEGGVGVVVVAVAVAVTVIVVSKTVRE